MIVDEYKNNLYVKQSDIEGMGLFTNKSIPLKSILAIPDKALFTDNYKGIEIKQSATRYCLKYFQYGDIVSTEDYLNHSNDPNCMYHCGVLFAIKNINNEDELTIDYSLIAPEGVKTPYVSGCSGEKAFVDQLKILVKIFNVKE